MPLTRIRPWFLLCFSAPVVCGRVRLGLNLSVAGETPTKLVLSFINMILFRNRLARACTQGLSSASRVRRR